MARRNPVERRRGGPRPARGGVPMLRLYCCLCSRPMLQASVYIGAMPVGPKCAKRAGLVDLAKRKSGAVFPAVRRHVEKPGQPQTRDLFEEEVAA